MSEILTDQLVLIAVGAHLEAERHDRPLAYELQREIDEKIDEHFPAESPLTTCLCTDIWYLNQSALHRRPTITLGGPPVNAVSCHFAKTIPVRLEVDEKLRIHLRTDDGDFRAAIYGIDRHHTRQATDIFRDRYLSDFVDAIVDFYAA